MTLFWLRKQRNCYWRRWGIRKRGWKRKVLRVNAGKTKVMWCRLSKGQAEDSGEHPCGVCRKGVGNNSIFCVECHRWVHKRCSGISGKLKSNADFHCMRCLEGENGLFLFQFCWKRLWLSPMWSWNVFPSSAIWETHLGQEEVEEAARTRVRCAWAKFKELSPILMGQGASYRITRKIYRATASVQSAWTYENWDLGDEESKSAKSGENGTDDGEMDVRSVAEG